MQSSAYNYLVMWAGMNTPRTLRLCAGSIKYVSQGACHSKLYCMVHTCMVCLSDEAEFTDDTLYRTLNNPSEANALFDGPR